MSQYWSPVVHQLTPYVPGEQPQVADLVKLNTNENPYPPSPKVIEALKREVGDALRLYPEPTGLRLREAIARREGLSPNQVFVGNSSDEVLAHTFQALLNHQAADGTPRPLLFPDITYAFYPVYCGLYGIASRKVPLRDDFSIDLADYRQADAGAVIFPNPNAPTGRALARADIEKLLVDRPDMVVVVDEAYVDFGAESAVPLIAKYPNVLVVQTMSKSRSLAGLRVGFAMGDAALIDGLTRVKDSFNSYPLDRLAQAGAVAAIEDDTHFETTRRDVMRSREQLDLSLRALGFDVLPSQANFLFVRHATRDGAGLAQALRERGILVRRFSQPQRIADHLRISVGTPEQCERLLQVLAEILA